MKFSQEYGIVYTVVFWIYKVLHGFGSIGRLQQTEHAQSHEQDKSVRTRWSSPVPSH